MRTHNENGGWQLATANVSGVQSWLDILEALYAGSWNSTLHRYRSAFAFRGLPSIDHRLTNALLRLGARARDIPRLELALLRNFRKYGHADAARTDSGWPWHNITGYRRACSTGPIRRSSRCTLRPRIQRPSTSMASSGASTLPRRTGVYPDGFVVSSSASNRTPSRLTCSRSSLRSQRSIVCRALHSSPFSSPRRSTRA